MQRLTWYMKRLLAMSPDEIVWRVRGVARDMADRRLLVAHARRAHAALAPGATAGEHVNLLYCGQATWLRVDERSTLLARADAIAAGRQRVFDHEQTCKRIDWNIDAKHGVASPARFAPSIDYRDFRVVGDCKFVWEPNRHLQWVVLGRAFAASRDERYLQALERQWASWLEQCPFGVGMNWRSPLEVAIRLINWSLTWELTGGAAGLPEALRQEILRSVYLHCWDTDRKYSRGSSANNHLIGEAAGVFIGSSVFAYFKEGPAWRREARRLLEREIIKQTFASGFTREQATGYHLFVLQFFTLAAIVARRIGEPFSPAYEDRLRALHTALATLMEGGGRGGAMPMIGDADDGAVTDLGDDALNPRGWIAVGAALFNESELAHASGGATEAVGWLMGGAAREGVTLPAGERASHSTALQDAGYYLLQSGSGPQRMSLLFDCGPLGYTAIAAHGHADALSFTLRVGGADVFVDPGTYDYFTYPAWREYFRSTRSHNTLTIDERDQSEMRGPFMWGSRANSRCVEWRPDSRMIVGEHDGYRRLPDPAIHRRRIRLADEEQSVSITDQIVAKGEHRAALWFHLAEDCRVTGVEGQVVRFAWAGGAGTLTAPQGTEIQTYFGSEAPIAGWVSRGYHRKAPVQAICVSGVTRGDTTWTSRIELEPGTSQRAGGSD